MAVTRVLERKLQTTKCELGGTTYALRITKLVAELELTHCSLT